MSFSDNSHSNSFNNQLLVDERDGFNFNIRGESKKEHDTNEDETELGFNSITKNSSISKSRESPLINFSPIVASSSKAVVYDFTPEELYKMKEKVKFELSRDRRHKEGDCMKSRFIQEKIKKLNFFPDPELNRLMTRLLLRLQYVKEAIRVTMYIFFDIDMFKEYYVPSSNGPSGISSFKPFPNYSRYHAFWQSIHCNDSDFLAKYTKGLIDGNSNFRKHAINELQYTGYVSHRTKGYAEAVSARIKSSGKNAKANSTGKSKSRDGRKGNAPSSKRFKLSIYNAAISKSINDVKANSIAYDNNGFAYILNSGGNRWYVKDPKVPPLTYNNFFTASRILLMKGRAYYLWSNLEDKLLRSTDVCWFSGECMSDVALKVEHMDYFPDQLLNQLVKHLIFKDITLVKAIKITIGIFFSSVELTKAAVPSSSSFKRVLRPPVAGYEIFHEFWNHMYRIWNSDDRRRRFEGSFAEVNRVYITNGQNIPDIPF